MYGVESAYMRGDWTRVVDSRVNSMEIAMIIAGRRGIIAIPNLVVRAPVMNGLIPPKTLPQHIAKAETWSSMSGEKCLSLNVSMNVVGTIGPIQPRLSAGLSQDTET
jgi:hypothetical protein